ncbi:CaiF/GrlA family transcriptional regulator [Klebsiella oxytoca]|uniref:CaiF/GrlA family transcriptional regulator n=1 Tax=Klebsiella oxytoca TaxID=571 RepID=UPI0009495B47|nr:CaiF/GrlA family transcriptional regulator [Klebsiella oxytoca]
MKKWKCSRKPQPYKVPEEIIGTSFENAPLYIIIAYWALCKKKPVTVNDVCKKFNISMRRASDLLEYLTEQGERYVKAECFLLPQRPNSRLIRRAWIVTDVVIE